MKIKALAFAIIAVATVLAYSSTWNDSLIVDEDPHIGAGYSYLVKQDMRLNPEHPPLVKDLAAIPLLFLHLNQDAFQTKAWTTDVNGQWDFGRSLIFQTGNDADRIAHWAKVPMLLFFILSAWIVFRWTHKRYGDHAAIIALLLFSFSPTIIAHARFVTTDVPALFGILLATYFFVQYLKECTRRNFWFSALALGVALLTKFSTFLLIPFFLILALVWGWTEAGVRTRWYSALHYCWRSILVCIVGFVVIVWPIYYFHTYHYPPERQHNDTVHILASNGAKLPVAVIEWMSDKPILRAVGQYGLGLLMVNQRAVGGNTTYFMGEVSAKGWKSYFPIVYFIKEPLAWWGLVAIALIAIATKLKAGSLRLKATHLIRSHFDEFAMLLWLLIYWGVTLRGNLNIGIRHLLPIYGFSIILISGQLMRGIQAIPAVKLYSLYRSMAVGLVCALLGWYIFANLRVYPHYLAYFNESVGGPAGGYRYVVDSNLDWGQDLKRLSDFVKQYEIGRIELDYFGWSDPYFYLKDRFQWLTSSRYANADDFKKHNTSNGWIAVSATFLQNSTGKNSDPHNNGTGRYNWLLDYQPITVIGHSIFVYQIK